MRQDTSATISLSDGRLLSYAQWGDPNGIPIIYLAGTPCSRYDALIFADAAAKEVGVRLIVPERPGSGLSTLKPNFTFQDVALDVTKLADHLGLQQFPIAALSGGGPYALACAFYIPDRLKTVAIVSGLGPLNIPELDNGQIPLSQVFKLFRAMGQHPWLAKTTYWLLALLGKQAPNLALRLLTAQMPPLDKAVLKQPDIWALMARYMLTEPFLNGVAGPAYEATLYAKPWGFPLAEIKTPIQIWHGDADVQCPVEMAKYIARQIPNVELNILPKAGHLLIVQHAATIFRRLIAT